MKKVSVITTFYNAENTIVKAIHSVNSQQYNHDDIYVEYVLVNDGSFDRSIDIIEDYMKNYELNVDFKLYRTPENLGCGGARKFGIDKATGDYLMFIDADDNYINNDFISRAVNDIINDNADIVEYGVQYKQRNGESSSHCVPKDVIINSPEIALVLLFKDNFIKIHVWSKIIKASLAKEYPYSILREYEDVDTIPKWVYYAKTISIKSSVEINYHQSKNSITTTDINRTRYLTNKVLCQYFEMFKDNKNILLAIYDRAMIDFKETLNNKTSKDPMFNEMSLLNTYMLSFIFPEDFQKMTFNLKR